MPPSSVPADGPFTHVLVVRELAEPGSGQGIQLKLSFRSEPTAEAVRDAVAYARRAYEAAFGVPPERGGAAVLPYYESEDGDGDDDSADAPCSDAEDWPC